MKVLFRTDASVQIGIGHVMRCLTLAEALREQGAKCRFVCREHPGHLLEQIRQQGFVAHGLPISNDDIRMGDSEGLWASKYGQWLGADWVTDATQTKVGAGDTGIDWLIVDHYAIDSYWEQAMRSICRKLMVIDDLAERQHDCDLLLDQNLGRDASEYSELVPEKCRILAGPRYALLRPEFAALREYSMIRRAEPALNRVLITMGGVDFANATGQVLEALIDSRLPKTCHITVVMGSHAPWLDHVRLLAAQMSQPTEVKVNVLNMAQLMADCDLAIGAAGSTSWERCCLGLPSLIVVLAENQCKGAAALEQSGSAIVLGTIDTIALALPSKIDLLTNDLGQLSLASYLIADGHGSRRVTNAIAECHG